ncbi:unnamed protein product [Acanthosepion pharaonis]|uniref:Uncharacterized protein n=1 Tax=Acanthosepion pharaonis TaxID=158019 RepID=A0A812DE76_ACAPH|nr:unnamed protein product [Sepia pharaonis]
MYFLFSFASFILAFTLFFLLFSFPFPLISSRETEKSFSLFPLYIFFLSFFLSLSLSLSLPVSLSTRLSLPLYLFLALSFSLCILFLDRQLLSRYTVVHYYIDNLLSLSPLYQSISICSYLCISISVYLSSHFLSESLSFFQFVSLTQFLSHKLIFLLTSFLCFPCSRSSLTSLARTRIDKSITLIDTIFICRRKQKAENNTAKHMSFPPIAFSSMPWIFGMFFCLLLLLLRSVFSVYRTESWICWLSLPLYYTIF